MKEDKRNINPARYFILLSRKPKPANTTSSQGLEPRSNLVIELPAVLLISGNFTQIGIGLALASTCRLSQFRRLA